METPILSVDGVNKHFGGLVAVEDLSFDVRAGEVIGLMGPNGAGKTTLLNVIAGEYKPDSGTVRSTGALHPTQRVRQRLFKSSIPSIRYSVGISN